MPTQAPLTIHTRLTAHTGFSTPQLGFGNVLEERMDEIVDAALRAGHRMSQLYGTERALARTLSRLLPVHNIPRGDITIVTKWNPPPIEGDGEDVRPEPGLSVDEVYEQLLRSKRDIIDATAIPTPDSGMSAGQGDGEDGSDVEAGNGKAQGQGVALEYIDVMLIHQPRPGPLGRARAWEALQRAKAEGWVKEIGVSNFSIPMLQALPAPVPAFNQIEIQPWHQPRSLITYCLERGILLIAFCPLARASPDRLADPVVGAISRRTGKSWGQALLRWSLQKGYIPIARTANVARVAENAALYILRNDKAGEGGQGGASGEGEEEFVLTQKEMDEMDGLTERGKRDEELGEGCSAPNAWKLFYLP